MPVRSVARFALVLAASLLLGAPAGAGAEQAQPGFDVLRVVDRHGNPVPYNVWTSWPPLIVPTPDGGAWAFFSAEPKHSASAKKKKGKLYAAWFDPTTALWQPARPMPGGEIQMGAAAVVDGRGTLHLIYSDRAKDSPDAFATLVYTRSDGNGAWTPPVPVALNPNAGHQLSGSLAVDGDGRIHAIWQDQRNVPPADQAKSAASADVYSNSLVAGAWTVPTRVNGPLGPDVHASLPQLAVDGDRVVAVWSIYQGTSREELHSAVRVEWSTRPLDPAHSWTEPQLLIDRGDGDIGGRLVDLAANPDGGVAVAFGRRDAERNNLFLRRLPREAEVWDREILLASGSRGTYPSLTIAPDGTTYVVYNVVVTGDPANPVEAGAVVLPPRSETPSEETILTAGEEGAEGWAAAATDERGQLWILYVHQPVESRVSDEVRCLRGATITPQQ